VPALVPARVAALSARLAAVCLYIAVLLCLVAPSASAATTYGINAGGIFAESHDQWDKYLASLRSSGITDVRMDFTWRRTEPVAPAPGAAPQYQWAWLDERVAALARHGLRPYALIAYSADWASVTPGDQMSRPADPAAYARYAAAVAQRYGANGDFWRERPDVPTRPAQRFEIWNEQNVSRFWREQGTAPADYAELYAASRRAIKQAAPGARVVTGGLVVGGFASPSGASFLRQMYKARPSLKGNVDAVGFHPYGPRAADSLRFTKAIRRTLDSLGEKRVPIELTELGFSTTEMPEEQRARHLNQLIGQLSDPSLRIGSILPYAALTNEGDPNNWEQWFGLLNQDGSVKPAGIAYASAFSRAGKATMSRKRTARSARTKAAKRSARNLVNVVRR
jgi:hypothetical protein